MIIAEIGQNHNGSIELAKQLMDMALKAGVKFVKFQKRHIKSEFTQESYNKVYDSPNAFDSIYGKHREILEFDKDQHLILKNYATSIGLTYFCTVCDIHSLHELEEIGCPFYKIASRDITNIPLLHEVGKIGKNVIISTGLAELEDIDMALTALNLPADKVSILQCTSQYPCEPQNCNLNCINKLMLKYPNNQIGYSDHTEGVLASTIAVTLGAEVIEKHITLDKTLKGTDQKCSAELHELTQLVDIIKQIPIYKGSNEKSFLTCCTPAKNKLMKSLTSIKDIPKNTILTEDMLCLKCPGTGIPWKKRHTVLGLRLIKNIKKDVTITNNLF